MKPVSKHAWRIAFFAAALGLQGLHAQPVVWDHTFRYPGNGFSDDFSNPRNWVGDRAPVNGQSIEFGSTDDPRVFLDEAFTAGTVSFGTGGNGFNATAFEISGNHTLTVTHGFLSEATSNSPIEVNVPVAFSSAITIDNGSSTSALDFSGAITGSGGITLTGTGAVQFSGTNTYIWGTTVASGELYLQGSTAGNPGSITSGPVGTGVLTLDAGSRLSPTGGNVTLANNLHLPGNGTIPFADAGSSLNFTLTGLISGSGGVEWDGNGALALSGPNTFTGGVALDKGTLLLGSSTDTALSTTFTEGPVGGQGSVLDAANGVIIEALGSGATITLANPITLGGSVQFGNGDNNNLILGGPISGPSGSLTYDGGSGGTLALLGANSYALGTTINSGTLIAGSNTALGTGSVALNGGSGLNVVNGIIVNNTLSFAGSPNVLSGGGTIASPVVANGSVILSPSSSPGNGPGTLTFSNGLTLATGGTLSFHLFDANGPAGVGYSEISATGGLTLTAATQTLTFNLLSIDANGNAAPSNFQSGTAYSWMFATSTTPIVGFTASQFQLVTSGFLNNTNGGTFSFSDNGNSLFLNFTPVPEPSTWALMGAGVLTVVPFALRRRRRGSKA
jgi:autotransporter-associated beta strand protein